MVLQNFITGQECPNPLPSQAGTPIWTYTKRAEGTDQGLEILSE
jgi:hypothetical protein